jgi:hypothetical protein
MYHFSLGLDPKLLAGILGSATGRCWSVDTYNPCPGVMPNVPSSNDYKVTKFCWRLLFQEKISQKF